MSAPSPQRYRSVGRRQGVEKAVLDHAVAVLARIRRADARITPVLTLRHLSELTGVPFRYLRLVVGRDAVGDYKQVLLKKRVPGRSRRRLISIPPAALMWVQKWIVRNILEFTEPHAASFAFHPGSRAVEAAEMHCGCDWLLKVDIEDFFHSISEGRVAAIFCRLGFQRLLAFELARLVTVLPERPRPASDAAPRWKAIPYYQCPSEGILPQGAPTSPMLANLAMYEIDETLAALSRAHGMRYTRYADDLAFSSPRGSHRTLNNMRHFRSEVLQILKDAGFAPNLRKTVIRGPGSRRLVLGILVDSNQPRLPREYKDMLRLHLHYLCSPVHGPSAHAKVRRTAISSLYHHVRGLIAWAQCVEPDFGAAMLARFRQVEWPPVQPRSRGRGIEDAW